MNPFYRGGMNLTVLKIPFFLLLAFLLFPLFTLTYIVSHDGPSHVYNADLIRQLLKGVSPASDFLILKTFPEPNWMGHFVLLLFKTIFSSAVSDKLFLAGYIILFPMFFLRLITRINRESAALAFLSIPFVYSIFFYLGVYNFLAGITILMLAISSVIPRIREGGNPLFIRIFIYSVLLYFSHLLALGVFMIVVATALLFSFLETPSDRKKEFINHFAGVALAFLPVLIFTVIFFANKISVPGKASPVTFEEMVDFLYHIRFLMTLTYDPELIYAQVVFGLFVMLLILMIIISFTAKDNRNLPFYKKYPFWLTCTLLMLLCYFVIPDEAASGGVVKFRFLLLFYLFLAVFLSVVDYPRIVNFLIVIAIATCVILKMNYMYPLMKLLNEDAVGMNEVQKHMEANSIVLPLNYGGNWLHHNLSNYIGTQKNILVLDNYEANTPHFPVEWKKDKSPISILGEFTGDLPLCADIKKFEKTTGHNIDYVMLWYHRELTDSCSAGIINHLKNNYSEVYKDGERVRLYKRN